MTRMNQITQQLQQEGLDALLIMSPAGCCYLSGCYLLTQTVIPERQAFVLLTASGETSYLVCNIEEHSAQHSSRIRDIHIYTEFAEEPVAAATRLLQAKGLQNGRIGVEMLKIPYATLNHLQAHLPQATFTRWDEQFGQMLMIKDDDEVQAITEAGQATRTAIENGMTGAASNSRELDVANRILMGIMDAGIVPMFNVFASGPAMMEAHAEATTRPLETGEIVRIDMGGRMAQNNYLSDMARTAVVGTPSPEQAAIYAKLLSTQTAVFDLIKPGIPISDLFHICQHTFEKEGLPFSMPHIGHGMGIGLHEAPMINGRNQTLVQEGMVLNIEPLVALPDRNESYHIEDLAVVTADGCRLMTEPHRELIRIPA